MVKRKASNGSYTIFINHNGDVFSFGDDKYGGNGHEGKHEVSPTIIPTLKHVTSVSIGNHHCMFR